MKNECIKQDNASWFVDYDFILKETALVVCGSDGVGTLFIILKGNHLDDFKEIISKPALNKEIHGCLGECIRYAAQSPDIMPERCTIGGIFSSKLSFTKSKSATL